MSGVNRVYIKSILIGVKRNNYCHIGEGQEQNPPSEAFLRWEILVIVSVLLLTICIFRFLI